jgi:pyruvate/2-oxoglutarate dehydrogenase complex dihydrolipoamide dehydrogenase (E3) component
VKLTRRVLAVAGAAALLGIGGDEIVQGLLDIMYAKAPCPVIQRAMHIHPTVFEMIPVMLEELRPLTPACAFVE